MKIILEKYENDKNLKAVVVVIVVKGIQLSTMVRNLPRNLS